MNFVCFNGQIKRADEPVITINNRAYKWGDAVFETIKVCNGKVLLDDLHCERLFLSLKLLKINPTQLFNWEDILHMILKICTLNNCINNARIRLQVFRKEDNTVGYSIEALPLPVNINQWKNEGLLVDYFPYGRKSCDTYANLKTASHLIYILAQLHAQESSMDDCIVLNTENNIADTSKANIFLVKNNEFYTPALNQGCINGVMRRYLINDLINKGFVVHQNIITETDILNADEVFITNAIIGMQWVKKIKQKEFGNTLSAQIFKNLFFQ